jgi:hypothetical protein
MARPAWRVAPRSLLSSRLPAPRRLEWEENMRSLARLRLPTLIAVLGTVVLCLLDAAAGATPQPRTVKVSGTGTDLLNGAIVHSKQDTATGMIQRSTETVDLNGDLRGRVLYQVTSVFDFHKNTLVNTGDQVFSGTVAGSGPVLLHDSRFRFEVDLTTGADTGSVYLSHHIAGPQVTCTLKVVGTGKDQDGNPTFKYSGECTFAADR